MGLSIEQFKILAPHQESCPHSFGRTIRHSEIGNYWPQLRLQQLNSKYTWLHELPLNTLEQLGFCSINGEICLKPISIELYIALLGRNIPNYLLHEGFTTSNHIYESEDIMDVIPSFDNTIAMQTNGIWGNPQPHMATFLKPPDSRVVPMARNGKGVRLFINIHKLQETRSVYVDPEMYIPTHIKNFNGAEHDIPGNSLMVFGGIPATAIAYTENITIKEL